MESGHSYPPINIRNTPFQESHVGVPNLEEVGVPSYSIHSLAGTRKHNM